jgi:hypothetical protein
MATPPGEPAPLAPKDRFCQIVLGSENQDAVQLGVNNKEAVIVVQARPAIMPKFACFPLPISSTWSFFSGSKMNTAPTPWSAA